MFKENENVKVLLDDGSFVGYGVVKSYWYDGQHMYYKVVMDGREYVVWEGLLVKIGDAIQIPKEVVDMVNSPDHYKVGGIETLDFIEAKLSVEEFNGYCLGNVLKYISRYKQKNGLEDIKKAQFYLNKVVDKMSKV